MQSRKIATDPWASIATGIVYQPMSRIVQSFAAGNLLSNWATFTADYELDLNGVYDGATKLIERTHTRTDKLDITGISDALRAIAQSIAGGSIWRAGYWLCNVSQGSGSAGLDVARMAPVSAGLVAL